MKTKRSYYLFVALAVCAFVGYSVAQLADSNNSPQQEKLDQATSLIAERKATEARALIATIPVTAQEHRIGKFYDALAIHVSGDQIGFLRALEKLPKDASGVPSDVEEDLAAREVQALHFFRKFEELLLKARSFAKNHAGSAHYSTVQDCLIAGLFDRGMKQAEDACRSKDEANFANRWPQAKANLEEFLTQVGTYNVTSYQSLPKRNLKQDIWVARLTLGDENALWGEVPASDVVAREQLSFQRVQLFQKLQKDEVEKNIKLANEFFDQFPYSVHRKRVDYELAHIALDGGARLVKEARTSGNGAINAAKRAEAAPHLALALNTFSRVVEDKEAGISKADAREARVSSVRVYYYQSDWDRLSSRAVELLANAPSEKEWLAVKLYAGAGLGRQGKKDEADKIFEEIMEIGFRNNPSYDGLISSAADWRIHIERRRGDEAAARKIVEQVQSSICVDSVKRTFLKKHSDLVTQLNPASK